MLPAKEERRGSVFRGLIPIAMTPFRSDERIDEEGLVRSLEAQVRAGVDGIMAPAFASEFHKLTSPERRRMAQLAIDVAHGHDGVKAIVSVPDHATANAVLEVQWACQAGADGINVLPPFFLGPSRSAQRAHLVAILEAAETVPVMVQYAPQLTGAAFALDDLVELATEYSNLQGLKVESLPPGPDITGVLSRTSAIDIMVGYAGLHMVDAMRRGARGVQPANGFPEIYRRIIDDWSAGRAAAAEELHARLLPYISYWMQSLELGVAAEKRIGFLRGWYETDRCRRPARLLDEDELRLIDRFVEDFDAMLVA